MWFSSIKILENDFKNCISKEYQTFKSQYCKHDPLLEFGDANIIDDIDGKSNNPKITIETQKVNTITSR